MKEVSIKLYSFITMVEHQFNNQVKIIRSDNCIKFTCINNYFLKYDILHKTSCIATPQQV